MATRDPFESYLKKASDLFESGDVVQAGQIWQAILKKAPNHSEARAGLYKVKLYFDARATQDGLAEERKEQAAKAAAAAAAAPAPPRGGASSEIVRLLEQGCTLYDAGHFEDAIARWEQVLEKDPGNVLAKGYITGAQRILGVPIPEENPADSPRATSALPADLYLGAGVLPAPPAPAKVPAPPPAAPEPAIDRDEIDRLLRDGCTLYDMGQPEDALKKWEKLLSLDPEHQLAQAYLKDARRDLGLDTLSDGAIPAPVELPPTGAKPLPVQIPGDQQERVDQLILEGTQLFDMGMAPEAIQKWEQVLALVPGHKEAESYLAMALREAAHTPASPPPPPPPAPRAAAPVSQPTPDDSEIKLKKGESLLHQGRFEESAFLFQEVLKRAPQNFRALQGLHQAQALLDARQASHTAPPEQLYPPTPPLPGLPAAPEPLPQSPAELPPPATALPVEPPATLTEPAPPPRKGLELPQLLRQVEAEIPAWLKAPKVIAAILGGVVLLNVAFLWIRANRRDSLLARDVAAFRVSAQAPVARNLDIADLSETPAAIRKEAESALGEDPLRAYYRAQELIRLSPLDGPAAQLMGRASSAMSQSPEAGRGSIREVEKLLQTGELDAAERMLRGLLCKSPDDGDLKARYARLNLALAELYAIKERWGDAEDQLKRGRAMYPSDKAWSARLLFLGRLKAMGAEERKAWIQFLG
jgi:tetratricopeptide (TPR) repeat protein